MACQKETIPGGGRFRCNLCCSTFSRNAHLQRHLQTHISQKPYSCQFCFLCFKRGDALRKHWKSCSLREMFGEPIPAQRPPGRRRRACDGCAATRQRCDLESPCGNCASKQRACSFSKKPDTAPNLSLSTTTHYSLPARFPRPEIDLMLGHGLDYEFDDLTNLAAVSDENFFSNPVTVSSRLSENGATIMLEWLVQFTTYAGLDNVFNFTTPSESLNDILPSDQTPVHEYMVTVQAKVSASTIVSGSFEISELMSWLSHPYMSTSKAIWDMVETYRREKIGSVTDSEEQFMTSNEFVKLFAPHNVEFFLDLYWNKWAHNCLIIHKASFDPSQTCPELLLVMVLIGALLSHEESILISGRKCLDIAERFIFQHPFFHSEATSSVVDDTRLHTNLDMLRSGLLISVLQTFEGSCEARSRMRHDRYHSVVLAARSMKFSAARHSTDIGLEADFIDWNKFIIIEEFIRTQTFIFLLDTAFTIFHNCTPRIMVSELDMSCSCTDYCFEAKDGAEFLARVQENHPDYGRTMKFVIRDVLQDIMTAKDGRSKRGFDYSNLTTLDLFTIISGIHSMIFCHQMSLSLFPSSVAIFLQGLQNWMQIWTLRVPFFNTSEIDRIHDPANTTQRGCGFTRHAREYHALAEAKLMILHGDDTTILQALELNAESEGVAEVVHLALGLKQVI